VIPVVVEMKSIRYAFLWGTLALALAAMPAAAQVSAIGTSENVSWDCTGSGCPWGSTLSGEALVWPAEVQALDTRLGYTTSKPIYAPAEQANGAIIWIDSGYATLYAGTPGASSHRQIGSVAAGESIYVSDLAAGEVLSVQGSAQFSYQIDLTGPAEPEVPSQEVSDTAAALVDWHCAGTDCPWGNSLTSYAAVWPAEGNAGTARLGYTTTEPVYLPDGFANGVTITVTSGDATLYAGGPFDDSHRAVATLAAGDSVTVEGLTVGEVLSAVSGQSFRFSVSLGDPASNGGNTTAPMGTVPGSDPEPEPEPDPDPLPPNSGNGTMITWTCTGSGCPWGSPLDGYAVAWPATANGGTARLGYTASADIYLPSGFANDAEIAVTAGVVSIYAGDPFAAAHRLITTLVEGESVIVTGLAQGEVLSIQGSGEFAIAYSLGDPSVNGGSDTAPDGPEPGSEPDPDPAPDPGDGSVVVSGDVTWTCTAGDCPWGSPLSGFAAIWPDAVNPGTARRGYTTSEDIYLPDGYANGAVIAVDSGFVSVYAGNPYDASHRLLASLYAGESYVVGGLATGEVLSAQGSSAFELTVTFGDPAVNGGNDTAPDGPEPGAGPDPDPDPDPDPAPEPGGGSVVGSGDVTWTCTGVDCPWGSPLSGTAAIWPDAVNPGTARRGYTTSEDIYLPDGYANGAVITVNSGTVSLYAGNPYDASHRLFASLYAGDSYVVGSLATGEVLSAQGSSAFELTVTFGDPAVNGGNDTAPDGPAPGAEPGPDPDPQPDPGPGTVYTSVESNWRCDIPGCDDPDWQASVVDFPSWSAYSSNNRTGFNSRTTYADDGRLLYPYMGSWADGCHVTVLSGTVLIIEWERGTDVWRQTLVETGQTYTLNLIGTEDGAMIETMAGRGRDFTVSLANCEPQPLLD